MVSGEAKEHDGSFRAKVGPVVSKFSFPIPFQKLKSDTSRQCAGGDSGSGTPRA